MISLSYFLYDNRTWSPRWGRDWGLKAATGLLAKRADLRTDFDRYCGALPGEQGQLAGFGAAVGGLRPRMGPGYLLCVTVGSSDSFGRPSWAVFGLWCPDLPTLDTALSGDPISAARALLGTEPLPAAFAIQSAGTPIQPRRSSVTQPSFHRFQPGHSADEVISILLGSVRNRSRLPNVLGVTASSRLSAIAGRGFEIVYCHPMDDNGERALTRALSSGTRGGDESKVPPQPGSQHSRGAQSRLIREIRIPGLVVWSAGVSAAIAAVVLGHALVEGLRAKNPSHEPVFATQSVPATTTSDGKAALEPKVRSREELLADVKARFEELKNLEPDVLRQSTSFIKATKLTVKREHLADQKKALDAFAALIEARNQLLKRDPDGYLAFYFDEEGSNRELDVARKLEKIAVILEKHHLGAEQCKTIRDDFGFEFDDDDSVVRQWCTTLAKLDETKRELRAR